MVTLLHLCLCLLCLVPFAAFTLLHAAPFSALALLRAGLLGALALLRAALLATSAPAPFSAFDFNDFTIIIVHITLYTSV